MKQAVIDPENNIVENVILADEGFEILGRLLVPSDTAGPGDTYDPETGTFTGPPEPDPPTLDDLKASARAQLAAHRYAIETGGVSVGGIVVATDRESQAMITGAVAKAQRDPHFTTRWKGADGSFTTVDADTILVLGDAVSDHVAACFAREADLVDEINAASDAAALEAIDITAGWP